MDASVVRADLLGFLKEDLVGPAHGENETLEEPPRIRYLAGILFPQETLRNESEAAGGVESSEEIMSDDDDEVETSDSDDELQEVSLGERSVDGEPEGEHDDTLTLANSYRPSAMGLSFFVRSGFDRLIVAFAAAVYESRVVKDEKGYSQTLSDRKPLDIADLSIDLSEEVLYTEGVRKELSSGLWLKGVFRRRANGQVLVTLSLFNATKQYEGKATTFYQCGFKVRADQSKEPIFVEYQSDVERFRDAEEASLAMLYRHRREYAVGHGCAAEWDQVNASGASEVRTTVLPSMVVPPVNPISGKHDFLDMDFLSGRCTDPQTEIPSALDGFCDAYAVWIDDLNQKAQELDSYGGAPLQHIGRCIAALERMRGGVEALRSDEGTLTAFQLANRVMLMQQHHSRLRRALDEPWVALPDSDEYTSDFVRRRGFWRTFQLAFILMNLRSVSGGGEVEIAGDSFEERDLVDLIWFPTGGGKTEAYLGLAAFMIFWRRRKDPDETGCKVLMRYTLRLLTSQQFQRAASLICACEIVRREAPEIYGSSPITIGLYVGQSLTPNKEKDALVALAKLGRKGKDEKNPFQLLNCPWCGTELNNQLRLGYADRRNRMIFLCPSQQPAGMEPCPFSARSDHLPICVVDDTIYREPPTLLIATVDKLAMLAWRAEAGSILTTGGGPELIIQDELHLISGPLGSMVGLYEGVLEYMCSLNGSKPKIVASTATIRRAGEQCRSLYDRNMFQFPPAGLDASDSFFAEEDKSAAGRLYVGFLPTAASSPLTAQIRSIVAMQQGLLLIAPEDADDDLVDPYWTLVQYFGSLKELGHAATFVTADIPEFIPTMHRRYDVEVDRKRWMRTAEELTSRKNEDEIPLILKRLEDRYRSDASRQEQALDTLLATNMISVGVDVDRLGLMMIVTQPKGTSEYIQASSRVGRSVASPGLVFTLYNAARPRDRSHYEHFCGYHQAYYRHVEPTSVTPFSPPAMRRALHAVLVIAGRHIADWSTPLDISLDDSAFDEFLDFLRRRVASIDADHLVEFDEIIAERLDDWEHRAVDSWGTFDEGSEEAVLMRPAGRPPREHDRSSWETPTSMRNVDVECQAGVLPRFTSLEEVDGSTNG